MKVIGILLNPLSWQKSQDRPIDPEGVNFEPTEKYRVYIDFNAVQPCGYAKITRTGTGALYAEADIFDYEDLIRDAGFRHFAVGVKHNAAEEHEVIAVSKLVCIALCDNFNDSEQPAVEVVDDAA